MRRIFGKESKWPTIICIDHSFWLECTVVSPHLFFNLSFYSHFQSGFINTMDTSILDPHWCTDKRNTCPCLRKYGKDSLLSWQQISDLALCLPTSSEYWLYKGHKRKETGNIFPSFPRLYCFSVKSWGYIFP